MKVAIYPGSFNPWHAGHTDILNKALQVFDKVIVAKGINPDKDGGGTHLLRDLRHTIQELGLGKKVEVIVFTRLLAEFINLNKNLKICSVIRGLRNSQDLEFERTQQYWNEDLGITVPTMYIVSDRKLVHISSSAIRAVQKASSGR